MGKLIVKNRYGVVPNEVLNSQSLSFKAKGLYAYIQSKPDDWAFSSERIADQTKEGRDSIRAGLKELEDAGYLVREFYKDALGRVEGSNYFLFDTPQSVSVDGKPVNEEPVNGFSVNGQAVPFSNKEYSKQEISKQETQKAGGEEFLEQQEYTPPPMPNTILSEMTHYWLKLNPNYKKIATPKVDNPAIRQIAERITGNRMFHLDPETTMKKWKAFCSVVLTNDFYSQKPLKTICNNIQTFLQDIEKAEKGHYTPPPSKNNSVSQQLIPQTVVLDGKKGHFINNGATIRL